MNRYLVWLEWPERCFRIDAEALRHLKAIVPAGSEVRRVRSEAAFLKALPRATHVLTWHFAREWYALAPQLRLVATPGAGRELVSTDAPAGVRVHFGGYHGAIIAETVVGFMFAWAHGFFRPELAGERPWRAAWPRPLLGDCCSLVAGTRAVIAGYGRIGRAIGAKLAALGVEVEGFGRATIAALPAAARRADWLILALPGDTGTDGFLGRRLLARLPKRCVVINIGRGNAVDEAALVEALTAGRLAGAYLDVFAGEPGPLAQLKGVNGARGILDLPRRAVPRNLIRTPHSSAFCRQYVMMCLKELQDEGLV